MTFTKRILLSWRLLRILPKLEFLDQAIPELEAMQEVVPKLEALERFLPKLGELDALIAQIENMEARLPDKDSLESITQKFLYLDQAVNQMQSLGKIPVEIREQNNGHSQTMQATMIADREIIHGWNRMKLLAKFALLASRSREIEMEWQRIQQDEHDASFAFQCGRSNETDAAYKKGIADGIKWCVNRFS